MKLVSLGDMKFNLYELSKPIIWEKQWSICKFAELAKSG